MNRRPAALAVAALVVGGLALYATNLGNALFWDDDELITTNPYVQALSPSNVGAMFREDLHGGSGERSNYYRPLLLLGFAVNYAAAGLDPAAYHWTGNLLHVANAVLAFLILSSATGDALAALLAAALFLIHPLQTEAVSYVSGRGDPLHFFFLLLALAAFWSAERRGRGWRGWRRPLSLVLLVAALLSHEKAIVFPFLLALFALAFRGREPRAPSLRRALGAAAPYFLVVLAYGICRLTFLDFANTLDFHRSVSPYSQHLYVRMFTFLHALLVYYRLLLLPTGLHMERDLQSHGSLFDLPVWTSALLLVALAAWLVALARRERQGFRIWLFGSGWFFATLGPMSGITPINAVIYEHWLYVGILGPATIAGWYLARAWRRFRERRQVAALAGLTAVLVAYGAFLATQTVRRNLVWGRPVEMFEEILRYDPENISANNNLGNIFYDRGDLEQAEFHYKVAAMDQERSPQPHYNLGLIYEERGQTERAVAQYERALAIDPEFYFAMQKLIEIHAARADFAQVLRWIEPLKRVRARDPHVFYNAARAYDYVGQHERALADARTALALAATYPDLEVRARAESLVADLER